jgi:hypothetical protein
MFYPVTASAASSSRSKPTTGTTKAADESGDRKPAVRTSDKEEIKALKAELVKQQQKKRRASPEEVAPSTLLVICTLCYFDRQYLQKLQQSLLGR